MKCFFKRATGILVQHRSFVRSNPISLQSFLNSPQGKVLLLTKFNMLMVTLSTFCRPQDKDLEARDFQRLNQYVKITLKALAQVLSIYLYTQTSVEHRQ